MKTFKNDYQEPNFIDLRKKKDIVTDTYLNLVLNVNTPTFSRKILKGVISFKNKVTTLFNIRRSKFVRISNHTAENAVQKRELTKNIVTEINRHKGHQKIKVRTDIDSVFLKPIR